MQNYSNTPNSGTGNSALDSASTIKSKVDGAMSEASSEFHNFVADIEDLVKETTTLTGEDLARAKAKLSNRIADAKVSIQEMGGDIAKRARQSAMVTNEYVHDQPWKAIGVGAVVGLLAGFALARRN